MAKDSESIRQEGAFKSKEVEFENDQEQKGVSVMPPAFQLKNNGIKEEDKEKNKDENATESLDFDGASPPPFQLKADQNNSNSIAEEKSEQAPFQLISEAIEENRKITDQKQSSTSAPGSKLPGPVQTKMEANFGADFSSVDIHKDSTQASALGAKAFAQGNQVHFAKGEYKPNSTEGQELIGHELTHVVQQRAGRVQPTLQGKGIPINDDKGLENEADQMGRKAARSSSPIQKKSKSTQVQGQAIQLAIDLDTVFSVVDRVHTAISGLGTNSTDLIAALQSLNRNKISIELVSMWYKAQHGETIMQAINGEWGMTAIQKLQAKIAIRFGVSLINADRTILRPFQVNQARTKLAEIGVGRAQVFLGGTIEQAGSHAEKQYIWKALAAGNDTGAIYTFAGKIRGKSAQWLNDNCRLTGAQGTQRTNTHGSGEQIPAGLQQQWNDSCTPTTALTVRGELDPIFALTTHENNPNLYTQTPGGTSGTSANPDVAGTQKTMMEGKGGVARPRGTSGTGNRIGDVNEAWTGNMGLNYRLYHIPTQLTWAQAIVKIDATLVSGVPVPARVAAANGSGGHAVSIISKSGSNYNIHDPWAGGLVTVAKTALTGGTLNIAGWSRMTHIEIPNE